MHVFTMYAHVRHLHAQKVGKLNEGKLLLASGGPVTTGQTQVTWAFWAGDMHEKVFGDPYKTYKENAMNPHPAASSEGYRMTLDRYVTGVKGLHM